IHGDNISGNREKRHHDQDYKIRKRAIEKFLGQPLSSGEDVALKKWIDPVLKMQLNDIVLIDALIQKIYKKFLQSNQLSQVELKEINHFFANQAINLAWLSKPISTMACLKCFTHGFRYGPAILTLLFKRGLRRLNQLNRWEFHT
ncbi:MAG: hypothetical protein WCP36_09055, partial [Methanomicrobiales archaeon]